MCDNLFFSTGPVDTAMGVTPVNRLRKTVSLKRRHRRPVFVSLSSVTPPPLPPPPPPTTDTTTTIIPLTVFVRASSCVCVRVYILAHRVRPRQSIVRTRACSFILITTIVFIIIILLYFNIIYFYDVVP